jgi:hypothetical protein
VTRTGRGSSAAHLVSCTRFARSRHIACEYTYFFCRNKQNGTCPSPHVNVIRIEDAVEERYATFRFSPEFVADVRTHLAQTVNDQAASTRLLKQQLTTQLHALDAKEENLIDLAADGSLPQVKIKQKLRDIERERIHLAEACTRGRQAAPGELPRQVGARSFERMILIRPEPRGEGRESPSIRTVPGGLWCAATMRSLSERDCPRFG